MLLPSLLQGTSVFTAVGWEAQGSSSWDQFGRAIRRGRAEL